MQSESGAPHTDTAMTQPGSGNRPPKKSDLPVSQQMSDMYAVRGRVVTPHKIITDGAVVVAGDAIAWVGESTEAKEAGYGDEILAAKAPTNDCYVLPGLIDVHNHGGGGYMFPSVQTRDQVMTAVLDHRKHGTTSMVASLVTASPMVLRERAELLADVCDEGELAGIHFEGPFVAQDHCGAQDPTHIQSPNPALTRELLVVSRGHCVSMTIAPEKPYAMGPSGVAETLIEGGAIPSFGHTDTDAEHARSAVREVREMFAKASHPRSRQATVTHLFNGMQPPHHRNPGPVFEFLADAAGGGVICELISDGKHLNPHIVTTTYELIGREQMVFITDSIAAGFPVGSYTLGTTAFTVNEKGEAKMPDGSFAGGTSHLIDVVRTAHHNGIPLVDAVYCASCQPARILGNTTIGAIEVGKRADLVVTDDNLQVLDVIRRGVSINS